MYKAQKRQVFKTQLNTKCHKDRLNITSCLIAGIKNLSQKSTIRTFYVLRNQIKNNSFFPLPSSLLAAILLHLQYFCHQNISSHIFIFTFPVRADTAQKGLRERQIQVSSFPKKEEDEEERRKTKLDAAAATREI